MPYQDASFGCILLLDVFEHLGFEDQPKALTEIHRILKPGGIFIASIPNLTHLNSRFRLMFFGRIDRSDNEINHRGERTLDENRALLENAGFRIGRVKVLH
ncbi:MAG: class I SAM-dependent methyltransferase [Desulfomonilaceae bacterium]